MRRLVPDAETRQLWVPVLARLLLWAAYAAGVAGAWLWNLPLADAGVCLGTGSAVIYGRAWHAAVKARERHE
jgi:hypothetical protein